MSQLSKFTKIYAFLLVNSSWREKVQNFIPLYIMKRRKKKFIFGRTNILINSAMGFQKGFVKHSHIRSEVNNILLSYDATGNKGKDCQRYWLKLSNTSFLYIGFIMGFSIVLFKNSVCRAMNYEAIKQDEEWRPVRIYRPSSYDSQWR